MAQVTVAVPTSWKTTLMGALMAASIGMTQATDPTVVLIGKIMVVVCPIIFGLVAKDSNVTGGTVVQASSSEAIAAVQTPPAP